MPSRPLPGSLPGRLQMSHTSMKRAGATTLLRKTAERAAHAKAIYAA